VRNAHLLPLQATMRVGIHRSWTHRQKKGMHCLADASPGDTTSTGRIVQGTQHSRDASSKGRIVQEFSFEDSSGGDTKFENHQCMILIELWTIRTHLNQRQKEFYETVPFKQLTNLRGLKHCLVSALENFPQLTQMKICPLLVTSPPPHPPPLALFSQPL
jgi:hypothetical protein